MTTTDKTNTPHIGQQNARTARTAWGNARTIARRCLRLACSIYRYIHALVKRPYWSELIASALARLQPTFSQKDPKHFHDPWRWHTLSLKSCSLPWSNILAQYIFDPAAMECLCISSNYLRAKLRCKGSIRSYCKQAVQHCRLSEAIASRLCSTAGCKQSDARTLRD